MTTKQKLFVAPIMVPPALEFGLYPNLVGKPGADDDIDARGQWHKLL